MGQGPLPDEPFVQDWQRYIHDIPRKGLAALMERLVQLRFPVEAGMSKNPNYQLATKRGLDTLAMPEATGAKLTDPLGLKVYLYQTLAGRIPVMETSNRSDFATLVRAFSHRNEPVEIPTSMGACLIKGYNNWDRVANYKKRWLQNTKTNNPEILWQFEFNKLKAQRELYQDTFLILTNDYYSGVTPDMLSIPEAEWRQLSMIIRREHEATHYFTLRFLGSARNHLLDELIADYMSIVAATGKYRADWFLCFMGLENYPAFRAGGRLTNYLKNVELTEEAFNKIKAHIKDAATNVEIFSDKNAERIYSEEGKYQMLLSLAKTNLIQLASPDAENILLENGIGNFLGVVYP